MSGAGTSPRSHEPLIFLSKTILAQICSLALTIFLEKNVLSAMAPRTMGGPPWREPVLLVCDLALVFAISRLVGMSTPWIVVNLLLPPALLWSLSSELSALYALAPLLVAILLYAPAFWTRVPYYPTPKAVYSTIAGLLPEAPGFRFADIGCGFGGLLSYLSRKRPDGRYEGVEIGVLPFLGSKLRLSTRRNARVRLESMWKTDLAGYDVVYCFLSPAPMARLWEKAKREMRPGSLLVSNSFEAPGIEPNRMLDLPGERGRRIFVYEM